MSRYSGRYGAISGTSQVQSWSVEETMTDNAQANSYTRGGKMRDTGIFDFTGTCKMLGKIFPGTFGANAAFSIELYTGGGVYGGNGQKLSGQALWTSITLAGDIASGARVTTDVQFSGDGALTRAPGTYQDTTTPVIMLAKDCIITYNGATVNWRNFNFTLTNEIQEYVGSDCVANGVCWKKKYPGLIDSTGTIEVADDVPIADNGDVGPLVITCDGTEIFKVGYARYMSTTGFTVDPSSGALVSSTGNFSMAAHNDSGEMGSLELFENDIWPPTAQ